MTPVKELRQRARDNLKGGRYWPFTGVTAAGQLLTGAASSAASAVLSILMIPLILIVVFAVMIPRIGNLPVRIDTFEELLSSGLLTSFVVMYAALLPVIILFVYAASLVTYGFLGMHLQVGIYSHWKNAVGGTGRFDQLFTGLNSYKNVMKAGFSVYLRIFAWSLLFYIPGIVAAYRYEFVPMILAENPTMTAQDAMERARRLSDGRKGHLFLLDLSFIGWILLCMLTYGIGTFFLLPYQQAARWEAYQEAKAAVDTTPVA